MKWLQRTISVGLSSTAMVWFTWKNAAYDGQWAIYLAIKKEL